MRKLVLGLLFFVASATSAQTFRLSGFLSARGVDTQSQQRSWLDGGFGRFETSPRLSNVDVAQIGADWTPATWIDVHLGLQARGERAASSTRRAGLVDAFVAVRKGPFQLRAGQFFLGTSRENRENLWTSPYTVDFSALNTWIAEEVRPVGAELQ